MTAKILPFVMLAALVLSSCGTSPKNSISVVTFNMYTGFDAEAKLAEFQEGADPTQVAESIITAFQATTPEDRISLAAAELARLSPDFICLQEVTLFSVSPLFYTDFLNLLVSDIKENGGPNYESIVSENITINESVETGAIIPASVLYKDREAILYKGQFRIEGEPVIRKLAAHRDPVVYQDKEYTFFRSLVGARFKYGSEIPISVFSTHLDQAYLADDVQKDQMQEIMDVLSDYAGDANLVVAGDFNSSEGDETYSLAPLSGFTDTFLALNPLDPGLTCCSLADLSNTEPVPNQRIDLIFSKATLWKPKGSVVILDTRGSTWPSDHFGVMTTFERIQNAED